MAEQILHEYIPPQSFSLDDIPVLHLSAQLPLLNDQQRINRYYCTYAKAFEHYCRHELLSLAREALTAAMENRRTLPEWQAHLSTVITYHDEHILSLYTDSTEQLDGRRLVIRRGDTWDLTTGLPLSAADFAPSNASWRKLLLQVATEQIQQQEQDGVAQFYPDWRIRLRQHFQPRRFYLAGQDICFFYPMFSIAPPLEGIPTFRLPLS